MEAPGQLPSPKSGAVSSHAWKGKTNIVASSVLPWVEYPYLYR